jgi:hypothetical protein
MRSNNLTDGETRRKLRLDFIGHPLRAGSGKIELRARIPGGVRLAFDVEAPLQASRMLRITGAGSERSILVRGRTSVSVAAAQTRRISHRTVTSDASREFPVELPAPRASTTDVEPVLTAAVMSFDPGF